MKRIIKVNNENAKNRLITIDYVFPKAITWLCRRKRIQSIVFVHVLNRKNNYSEAKFSNFLLFYFNSPGQYIFRLPVSPYTAKFVITFKKQLFLKSFHWKQYELQLIFLDQSVQ